MNIKDVDLKNWPRREAYQLFRSAENPFFSLTTEIDITPFMHAAKKQGISQFNFTLFNIMRAVNAIDELKTRFDKNRILQTDKTSPSFTVPIQNNEFAFCEVEFDPEWEIFNARCLAQIAAAKKQSALKENARSLFYTYLSCMPWIHFTGALHPTMNADDCIPRIVWGKYTQRGDNWVMALNLQAHHALADGYHAADFFLKCEQYMTELPAQTHL